MVDWTIVKFARYMDWTFSEQTMTQYSR